MLAVTACGGPGASGRAATVQIMPANGAETVRPDGPVVAKVQDGRIRSVVLSTGTDHFDGQVSPDGHHWTSRWALTPGTRYDVTVTVVGSDGHTRTAHSTFHTRKIRGRKVAAQVTAPQAGQTVGVGMPIVLHFGTPVRNRAAVESQLEVRTSTPVTGAWHWFSDSDVVYRPRHYWPAHTQVRLVGHLGGVRTAGRHYGKDIDLAFRVGDSHITTASARNHHQVVRFNGRKVRRMAISMGKGTEYRYTTTNGIHLTMEKSYHVVMDSSSVGCPPGCPDYYKEDVYDAVRISNSGEYEHSAPWSVGSQGHSNVSHGCINMAPADARWFYAHAQPGDIVKVTGTSRPLEPTNGWGYWQSSWTDWQAGSALKPTATPAPTGTPAQPPTTG